MTTITWTNTAGGNWQTAADWSSMPAVPTATDDIVITQPGTYTITAALAEAAHSVLIDSPNATLVLDAPLDVAAGFTLNAGTVVFNGSPLEVGSFNLTDGVLTGPSVDITASNTIVLNGGSILTPSATLIDPAGTITLPTTGAVQTAGIATPMATDWTQSVPFTQLPPSLGRLLAVDVGLTATLSGSVSVQSLEGTSTTVTASLTGSAMIASPSRAVMGSVSVYPTTSRAAGSSAVLMLSGTASAVSLFNPGSADLAALTGTGSVPLTLQASAYLHVSGPANMQIFAQTSAAAMASLQYAYAPAALGSYYSDAGASQVYSSIFSSNVPFEPIQNLATTAPQVFTFADQTTGWSNSLAVAPFDPSLGMLEAVNITLSDDILASVAAENEGSTPGTVFTTQSAAITLGLPGGHGVTTEATVTDSIPLGGFDGTADFAGTSGHIDQGITRTAISIAEVTGAAELAAYLGQGTVTLTIADSGSGTLNGPGNVLARLLAQSGATVSVSYSYVLAGSVTAVTPYEAPPDIFAGAGASFLAGSLAPLDTGLVLSDGQSATLSGATVGIGVGFATGDLLTLDVSESGITARYNQATGVLALTGSAGLAAYQAALEGVSFTAAPGDPTSGGTDNSRVINWSISDGTSTASATSSLSVGFASDPNHDILFQDSSGQMALWQLSDSASGIAAGGLVGPSAGSAWFARATGGFFTGDVADIAWQNQNGSVALWQVQGTTLLGGGLVAADPGPSWHIRGTGDFYGDGHADLLWQNDSGAVGVWEMTGTTISNGTLLENPGPSLHVEGTGDFYGDGTMNILLQADNGAVVLWDVAGSAIIHQGTVANPGPSWRIEGTGDFYGDGHTDILWQNDNGEVGLWEMNGTTIIHHGIVTNPGPTWHIVGTADFNNDGRTDILFQNEVGSIASWEMAGETIMANAMVASPGTSWHVIGGDGMRFVYSGAADDTLAATPAAPEEFVFTNATTGAHTISGFEPTQDIIELSGAQFANFAAVQAAATATPNGAIIDLGHGASLLLSGIDPISLSARDFALT